MPTFDELARSYAGNSQGPRSLKQKHSTLRSKSEV
jgi:hypothetical protein